MVCLLCVASRPPAPTRQAFRLRHAICTARPRRKAKVNRVPFPVVLMQIPPPRATNPQDVEHAIQKGPIVMSAAGFPSASQSILLKGSLDSCLGRSWDRAFYGSRGLAFGVVTNLTIRNGDTARIVLLIGTTKNGTSGLALGRQKRSYLKATCQRYREFWARWISRRLELYVRSAT